jgi:ribonuclease T1
MRPRNLALLLVVLLLFGWQAWQRHVPAGASAGAPAGTSASPFPHSTPSPPATRAPAPATRDDARADADADAGEAGALPREVPQVLARIRAGGPFPYERDGVVFGNFEGHLPRRARGYYHEYTVPTPGEHGRGARRIIAGGNPPREFWYTGDHYDSFVRLKDLVDGAGRAP